MPVVTVSKLAAAMIEQCRELAGIGIQQAIFNMPNVHEITPLEVKVGDRTVSTINLIFVHLNWWMEGKHAVITFGTDNAETRFLLNDVAVKHGVPWVYGACVGTEGRVMVVRPPATACLRCVFP